MKTYFLIAITICLNCIAFANEMYLDKGDKIEEKIKGRVIQIDTLNDNIIRVYYRD